MGAVQGVGAGQVVGAGQGVDGAWGEPLRTDAHDGSDPVVPQVHDAAPLQSFLVDGQGLRKVVHGPTDGIRTREA